MITSADRHDAPDHVRSSVSRTNRPKPSARPVTTRTSYERGPSSTLTQDSGTAEARWHHGNSWSIRFGIGRRGAFLTLTIRNETKKARSLFTGESPCQATLLQIVHSGSVHSVPLSPEVSQARSPFRGAIPGSETRVPLMPKSSRPASPSDEPDRHCDWGIVEVQSRQAGQPAQLGQARIADLCVGEDQLPKARHALQMNQSGTTDRGSVHPQRLQLRQRLQVCQSAVGNVATFHPKPGEIRESFEMFEAGICDPRLSEPQTLKVGHSFQMFQTRIGDLSIFKTHRILLYPSTARVHNGETIPIDPGRSAIAA